MSLKIDRHLCNDNSLTLLQKVLISQLICTHEAGSDVYPISECFYTSIEDWERSNNRNFFQEFSVLYRASWGAS